jgi:hypothetical protein
MRVCVRLQPYLFNIFHDNRIEPSLASTYAPSGLELSHFSSHTPVGSVSAQLTQSIPDLMIAFVRGLF